ncbi:MAG: cytochrome b/b6 domain-containing protein [Burkholderiaceae bacterium]|nr:cytochrome b/b6 domain-containing protein [Burkholderiaceae bacterium]
MNTTSASPAERPGQAGDKPRPAGAAATVRILVWDAPVRVFHWLMVACFATAYLTAETERWRLLHVTAGYTMAGLVAFRLLWGLLGTRHARFASFVRGPQAVVRYLKSLVAGHPEHHVGHNPAGAVAILLLLGLTIVSTATGYAIYNELGPEALEEVHEFAGNAMLAVVIAHVAAVLLSNRLHGENLVRAMVTGFKNGPAADGVRSAWRSLAALMLVAVLGFWAWQWQTAPAPGDLATAGQHATHDQGNDHDEDDD